MGTDQIKQPEMSAEERAVVARMISDPADLLFPTREEFEFFPRPKP